MTVAPFVISAFCYVSSSRWDLHKSKAAPRAGADNYQLSPRLDLKSAPETLSFRLGSTLLLSHQTECLYVATKFNDEARASLGS